MSSRGTAPFKGSKTLLCIVFSDLLKRNANQIGSPCILLARYSVSMTPGKMFRRPVAGATFSWRVDALAGPAAAVKSPSYCCHGFYKKWVCLVFSSEKVFANGFLLIEKIVKDFHMEYSLKRICGTMLLGFLCFLSCPNRAICAQNTGENLVSL